MPNLVTPFTRRSQHAHPQSSTDPRHRRDGYFDDHDQWHDSSEASDPAANRANG